jgi:flagellar basal-body rod protein FlgG
MSSALHTARSGLDAQDMRMRVISNNLANVNTTGFKRDRAEFQSLMYQNYRQAGANSEQSTQYATGLNIGTGVRIVGTERINTQGSMQSTDNPTDMAINGSGYFQVLKPDGTITYTRDGSFTVSAEGLLVTNDGYPLQPDITIPEGAQSLTIGKDGTVSIVNPGDAAPSQIGQIQVANFLNPAGLQPLGDNLFAETAASGAPIVGTPGVDGLGEINQNMLETSNVNMVEEMVNMIETQRAYEVNSKVISTVDGMMQYVTQNL